MKVEVTNVFGDESYTYCKDMVVEPSDVKVYPIPATGEPYEVREIYRLNEYNRHVPYIQVRVQLGLSESGVEGMAKLLAMHANIQGAVNEDTGKATINTTRHGAIGLFNSVAATGGITDPAKLTYNPNEGKPTMYQDRGEYTFEVDPSTLEITAEDMKKYVLIDPSQPQTLMSTQGSFYAGAPIKFNGLRTDEAREARVAEKKAEVIANIDNIIEGMVKEYAQELQSYVCDAIVRRINEVIMNASRECVMSDAEFRSELDTHISGASDKEREIADLQEEITRLQARLSDVKTELRTERYEAFVDLYRAFVPVPVMKDIQNTCVDAQGNVVRGFLAETRRIPALQELSI